MDSNADRFKCSQVRRLAGLNSQALYQGWIRKLGIQAGDAGWDAGSIRRFKS